MAVLIFDTSTVVATAAVGDGAQTLAEAAREVTTHSEGLIALIDEVLMRAGVSAGDLRAIACGRGPGSYTGLRIGLATAKGLCFAAHKPLLTFSSLLLPALAVGPSAREEREVLALLDARRGEVFGCRYVGGVAAGEEFVCRPEAIEAWVDPRAAMVLVGDGAQRYAAQWAELLPASTLADGESHAPRASRALETISKRLELGDSSELASAAPVYLRAPDIRKPKQSPPVSDGEAGDHRPSAGEGEKAPLSPELLEELRRSGLRLDREGRWWHEGQPIRHVGLARALHRWIDRLEDGRYVLRLDEQRYAYIDVEDTPFLVRRLRIEGEGETRRIFVELSDESSEELAYASLRTGERDALYCEVKGRFLARLTRPAHFTVGELLEQEGEAFILLAAGQRFVVAASVSADELRHQLP